MGDMVHYPMLGSTYIMLLDGGLAYVAQLYTPYILGYGTSGLSGGKAGWTLYECVDCGNKYKHKGSLQRHIKYECRKQPSFKCPYCVYRAYQKHNLLLHERHLHKDLPEKHINVSMSGNPWTFYLTANNQGKTEQDGS
ncbi:hypothetical protein MSG28_005402 [Choristoneura fumiferana]|uniref:Uncharacterized protein n=1 Tax=Choristoneura fumiferana TaxID=7141 RepID=A0ACC0JR45_CHOFU|nr:hypothetical protein MSG28_005402 [Choristoneura fumiferana]